MTSYRHTQPGTLIVVSVGLGIALTLAIGIMTLRAPAPARVVVLVVLALLVLSLVLFRSLTVEIGDGGLAVRFGPGWIRKTFALGEIRSAREVRNAWWYGWGIRFTPHGWLYNVSGLDAVEIALENGRSYRIGTDEPARLAAAIREAAALDGGS